MRQLSDELRQHGKICVFFNLDYQTDMKYFSSHDQFLEKVRLEFGDAHGYIFIDEIQRLGNAGFFLKGLYDLPIGQKLVVSGSGSLELKEYIKESLAGRKRIFNLLPVSFAEFVDYKTNYRYSGKLVEYLTIEREKYLGFMEEYLRFGGYPRIVIEQSATERLQLMNEIFTSYAEKDLTWLLGIKEPHKIIKLISLLAVKTGRLMNYSELATQCMLQVPALKEYLYYLEQTFSVAFLKPFFGNRTKELTKSQIPYFLDNGLRNFAFGAFGSKLNQNDVGFLFQNAVYNQLQEQIHNQGWELKYWRTIDKAEIDFIIDRQNNQIPVEAKYTSLKRPEVTRSLRSFIKKYNPETAWVVNLDYEDEIKENGTKIKIVPFYRMLEEM